MEPWRRERFVDRHEAGRALAGQLERYANRPDVVVLALPRGGVPVAAEVARALHAPLDVFVVRKIGMPGHREYAIGALASGGVRVLDVAAAQHFGVPQSAIEAVIREEEEELSRREREYREGRERLEVRGRTVILVDDGLATGSTMRAAVQAVRALSASRVIVAAPVGASDSCRDLATLADDVVCVRTPEPFAAVGLWYQDFSETTDDEVRALLDEGRSHPVRDR